MCGGEALLLTLQEVGERWVILSVGTLVRAGQKEAWLVTRVGQDGEQVLRSLAAGIVI